MSKNRMINTRFWSDSFVVDNLNALDRYLFLYLLTNEHTNIIGIYELPLRTASFETGIEKDDLISMIKRLSPKVEFLNGWVYIRRFTDHQQLNPNIKKGMRKAFFMLPKPIHVWVIKSGIDSPTLLKITDEIDSLSKPFKEPLKPELEIELETESKPKLKVTTKVVTISAAKTAQRVPKGDIDKLFGEWVEVVGYAITSQAKSNREYAAKLIREYDIGDIHRMIQGVAMSHSDQYAPRISNFVQLYKKWDDLKAWGKRSMTVIKPNKGIKI